MGHDDVVQGRGAGVWWNEGDLRPVVVATASPSGAEAVFCWRMVSGFCSDSGWNGQVPYSYTLSWSMGMVVSLPVSAAAAVSVGDPAYGHPVAPGLWQSPATVETSPKGIVVV